MGELPRATPSSMKSPDDRLDSWKEIAAYLNRDVTTVQRWEKREGMPVHRHVREGCPILVTRWLIHRRHKDGAAGDFLL